MRITVQALVSVAALCQFASLIWVESQQEVYPALGISISRAKRWRNKNKNMANEYINWNATFSSGSGRLTAAAAITATRGEKKTYKADERTCLQKIQSYLTPRTQEEFEVWSEVRR